MRLSIVLGTALAALTGGTIHGQTIVSDNYSVTGGDSATTGFALDAGVNTGINPPTNRMTGTAASNLRYIQTATAKPATSYDINANRLRVTTASGSGRFTLSADGSTPYNFASDLGIAGAAATNPAIYEIRISMRNNAANNARFSFALATDEDNANFWDFGIQLYRAGGSDDFYTIQKRIDRASYTVGTSGGTDGDINAVITTTAPATHQTFIPFLIRVNDAGSESTTYSSRVQVSMDNGSTWFYDSATDPALTNGWRLDGSARYLSWDQAGNTSGNVLYDTFSVTSVYAPPPPPDRVWTGGGTDDNWSTGANWGGTAPVSGEPLIFGLSARQSNFNDISSLVTPTLTFTNGGFFLDGNLLGISTAVINLAGNNTINLPLDLPVSDTKSWQVATGSALTLSGFSTVSTTGDHVLSGGGDLRITGSLDINLTPAFILNEGRIVLDGGAFNSLGGYRIGSLASASAPVETVVSNSGSLTLEVPTANLRVGDANGTLARLVVNNGTVTLFGGALGIPYAAGATGEVAQTGGLIKDCYVAFSDNGAGVGTFGVTNGVLEPYQIRKDNAGGAATIRFNNSMLRPAIGAATTNFMDGLDLAEILSGGLTIDATSDITIAQPLSGAGGLTKVNFSTVTLSGANTYAGNTIVQEGKLVLPTVQTNSSTVQVASAAELGIARNAAGTTLTAGSLNLGASTLTFDLGTLGNPAVALARVPTLAASGGPASVTVNVTGGLGLTIGQFTLIDYSGAIGGGFGAFNLVGLPSGVSATLVNNVANSSIDLLITAAPGLRWTGANGSSWDYGTVNWFDDGVGAPGTYTDGQPTRFVDGAATGIVDLTSGFSPASLLISNNVLPYVFGGFGSLNVSELLKTGTNSLTRVDGGSDTVPQIVINAGTYASSNTFDASLASALTDTTGTGTFAKTGPAVLTVSGDNSTYDGPIAVQQGTFKAGTTAALGTTNGGTTVASGATLDLNDIVFPHEPATVSGSGVGGQGAIIDSTAATGVQHNLTDVTLAGDAVFGAPNGGRWDIRVRPATGPGPGLRGNGFNLTKVGSGFVSIACQRTLGVNTPYWEMNLGNILISEGTLALAESLSLGNPGASLTVSPGAILQFFDMGLTNPIQRTITMTDARINCDGGSGGTNVLNGAIQLTGSNVFNVNQAVTVVNGAIGGSGSLTVTLSGSPATGTLLLNGANTHAGDTTVLGGTVGGNGSLSGNLIVNAGTLAPGTSLGTFTVQGNLTLGSGAAAVMEIDRPNSDRLVVNGTLTFGGTLTVVIPGGASVPQAGDVYQLFSKGGGGGFTAVTLPDISGLPGGLSWNTNDLLTLGRISVQGAAVPPTINPPYISGGNLILTGGGGAAGGSYSVLTSTNVEAPLTTWTTNVTGNFGGDGSFSNAIPVNSGEPRRFFLIKQP